MYDVLARTLPLVALAFLATAMFGLGLELTMRQIVEPLRDRRLLASSLLANVVVVPLIAVLLSRVIPMHEALAIGIVVYALAAGTEGGPKFVQIAGGNAGFAIGLLAVLLTFTIVLMPVALSFVVPGAHVDRGGLLVKLMLAVAVPVGLGLFLRARFTAFAVRLAVVVHRGSLIFLAAVLPAGGLRQLRRDAGARARRDVGRHPVLRVLFRGRYLLVDATAGTVARSASCRSCAMPRFR